MSSLFSHLLLMLAVHSGKMSPSFASSSIARPGEARPLIIDVVSGVKLHVRLNIQFYKHSQARGCPS